MRLPLEAHFLLQTRLVNYIEKKKEIFFFTQTGAEDINGFEITATFLTDRKISDILQRTVLKEWEKIKLLCCCVFKKFSIYMLQNDVTREKLNLFNRIGRITAKLPQV